MKFLQRLMDRMHGDPKNTDAWQLSNAASGRNRDPRSFSIPPQEQRLTRAVGDRVRVRFERIERLPNEVTLVNDVWVDVSAADQGVYRGVVQDGQALLSQLEGQEISFRAEHILAIVLPESHVLPYALQLKVSEAVADDDQWPSLLRKSISVSPDDSGWQIVAASANFSAATKTVTGDCIIQKFQVLDSVLDEPALAVWRWCADSRDCRART